MEINLFGHEGVDAAFDFVEAGPAPRPFVLALAGLARAGHAADGLVTMIVQRIVGDFVLTDVFPDGFARPGGHRVQFDNVAGRL